MTRPRGVQVCVQDTPYYHIVSRCVRRSYLCGYDKIAGKSYEHRRQWIENRIRLLSSIYAIDICAYAVMSNHIHLVVKICPERAAVLDEAQVLERWICLFKGPLLVQKQLGGAKLTSAENDTLSALVEVYRQRLSDLGWFMKCLNEPIARQANREDCCTGHFPCVST